MKKLLKLFSIISLGATPVMSVVACDSKDNSEVRMNEQVAKNLGLVDVDGSSLQAASLKQASDKVEWEILASQVPIKANSLLKTPGTNSEAKDDASYDFITKTLNIQPLTGTKNFDDSVLVGIEGQITNINPTLKLVTNNGYHVLGGNFSFQFMKKSDSTVLGPKYSIALMRSNTTDVVTDVLQRIIPTLLETDTDVVTNDNIKFKTGDTIPYGAVKGAVITVNNASDTAKAFHSLSTLLGLNIIVQLESITGGTIGQPWAGGNSLIISCKTAEFDFNINIVKVIWTLL